MTEPDPAPAVSADPAAAANTEEPQPAETPTEPEAAPTPPPTAKRTWSAPKAPLTREQADEIGRVALKTILSIARFIADVARYGLRIAKQLWRAIDAVPPTLQLLFVAGLVMLLGLVGSIALTNSLGLICTVVVVPVCSITLGALGHRWYSGLGEQRTQTATEAPAASDLQRSVEYVDKKLAVALTSFGTERHQQAVIALFQAKTAVELTLGTEQDPASYVDMPLPADEHTLRPRIRVGSASKSHLRESNSLAAS
ncbi:hypothetical protein M1247_04255 [Mycobacterium sp. 21AC1]|uniref:hypothetical protein n=1 Tax=[Mycobacterium] appelbergii TaxID=2939269 RepID=UPI002938EA47|nr:hypothetical protein [Mycobacterium sp. 21AC1]MDV3124114.1 hypothetical protein [Mycobacterium sp. 21AC1]